MRTRDHARLSAQCAAYNKARGLSLFAPGWLGLEQLHDAFGRRRKAPRCFEAGPNGHLSYLSGAQGHQRLSSKL